MPLSQPPISFHQFKSLISALHKKAKGEKSEHIRMQLASYGTLACIEGSFGLQSYKLLNLSWAMAMDENVGVGKSGCLIEYNKWVARTIHSFYNLAGRPHGKSLVLSSRENSKRPVSIDLFSKQLKQLGSDVGFGDSISWSCLRKTCILEAYKSLGEGKDAARVVRDTFGFANTGVMLKYIGMKLPESTRPIIKLG